jgi:hypothetical protein
MHVFSRPSDGKIALPGLQTRPDNAAILGGKNITITGAPGEWSLEVPDGPLDPLATVICLDFKSRPVVAAAQPKPDAGGTAPKP